LISAARRRQLSSPTSRRNGHRASAARRRNRGKFVAAVHRRRKHQLGGRRRLWPLATGGMGVWRGHPRLGGGKSGLLPILALTAAQDRKMILCVGNRTTNKQTTIRVD